MCRRPVPAGDAAGARATPRRLCRTAGRSDVKLLAGVRPWHAYRRRRISAFDPRLEPGHLLTRSESADVAEVRFGAKLLTSNVA